MAQKQDFQPKKILIFASGNGSNFEAIVKHFNSKVFCTQNKQKTGCKRLVEIELVTDNKNAPAIERAKKLDIPYYYVDRKSVV